jgi:hypothetical protein
MKPETPAQRRARQERLAEIAQSLGLMVNGDIITVPLDNPITIDASAIDLDRAVISLMFFAYQQGVQHGQQKVGAKLHTLIAETGALQGAMPQEAA